MNNDGILLIGCGKQAEKHIAGLRASGVENIVLQDIDGDLARGLAKKTDLNWVEDVDAALSDDSIVAVDICTPTPSHYPLLKSAFEAGKHAFCEKPFCETSDQARELAVLADRKSLKCAVGYIYRFVPAFELLKELLEGSASGAGHPLGRITCATLKVGGRGSHAEWKHTAAQGGGAINEMLVHMLDLAIWLFGREGDVELLIKKLLRPRRSIGGREILADAEDYVVLRADLGGVESLIEADLVTPAFLQQVQVQGENGSFMGSIQPSMPNYLLLLEGRGEFDSGMSPLVFEDTNLFAKQMADFVKMLKEPTHKPRCPISDSLRLMELIEDVRGQTGSAAGG